MSEKRNSIRATYDSRATGPRYHVTSRIDGRVLTFQHRIDDPFVRHTVTVGWRDLLRGLLRRRLVLAIQHVVYFHLQRIYRRRFRSTA